MHWLCCVVLKTPLPSSTAQPYTVFFLFIFLLNFVRQARLMQENRNMGILQLVLFRHVNKAVGVAPILTLVSPERLDSLQAREV